MEQVGILIVTAWMDWPNPMRTVLLAGSCQPSVANCCALEFLSMIWEGQGVGVRVVVLILAGGYYVCLFSGPVSAFVQQTYTYLT